MAKWEIAKYQLKTSVTIQLIRSIRVLL